MSTEAGEATPRSRAPRLAVLGYGFRPFFLLAALHAVLVVPAWLVRLHGAGLPAFPAPPLAWHVHEMTYGFVQAAIAGFLLTAVPSWTGRRGFAGAPLAALAAIWLAGRVAMSVPLDLPAAAVAGLDLAFTAALALAITPSLVRSGNRRNLVFVALLTALLVANLEFHLRGAQAPPPALALNAVLVLVALVGGRVTPAFTAAWLRGRGVEVRIPRLAWLDGGALVAVTGVLVVDLVAPGGTLAGAVAVAAAVLLSLRLARWQGWRCAAEPLVWVLHLGYAWLPVALGLKAAMLLGVPLPGASWVHALTVGAFATMILAIMTRASLGHTGRPLVAPASAAAAYGLVTAAALARVFGPVLAPGAAATWVWVAGLLWTLAFAAFLVGYAPMLLRPRLDGRAG